MQFMGNNAFNLEMDLAGLVVYFQYYKTTRFPRANRTEWRLNEKIHQPGTPVARVIFLGSTSQKAAVAGTNPCSDFRSISWTISTEQVGINYKHDHRWANRLILF